MENSVIDLNKVEEETKKKIAAVNHQKVTIVSAFMAQMKVRTIKLYWNQTAIKKKKILIDPEAQ